MAKPVVFCGSTRQDLKAFPASARREAGFQIERVQDGEEPDDWKPMPSIGAGVCEIRIHDGSGAYRVIYVAKFQEAIFILHCFQKKTMKTPRRDMDIAQRRLRELARTISR